MLCHRRTRIMYATNIFFFSCTGFSRVIGTLSHMTGSLHTFEAIVVYMLLSPTWQKRTPSLGRTAPFFYCPPFNGFKDGQRKHVPSPMIGMKYTSLLPPNRSPYDETTAQFSSDHGTFRHVRRVPRWVLLGITFIVRYKDDHPLV